MTTAKSVSKDLRGVKIAYRSAIIGKVVCFKYLGSSLITITKRKEIGV